MLASKILMRIKTIHLSLFFSMFNELRSEVIVRFVDVGGIIDHHCFTFCHNLQSLWKILWNRLYFARIENDLQWNYKPFLDW